VKQSPGVVVSKKWREQRRERAFALTAQDWTQSQIAQALGVSQTAVSRWLAVGPVRDGRSERRGRPAKLAGEHLRLVPDLLSHGAEVWGFRGEVWTCARVAAVIQEEFGVRYSPSPGLPFAQGLGVDAAATHRACQPARRSDHRSLAD